MEKKNNIEKVLEGIRVKNLSQAEKVQLWYEVSSTLEKPAYYQFSLLDILTKKPMLIPIAIFAALFLGAGATVAASDGARPGDLLFGIDRTVEDIRLKLADDDKRNDLRVIFSEERIKEIEDIVNNENSDDRDARVALGIETATSFIGNASSQIALSADQEKIDRIQALVDQLNNELGDLSSGIQIDLRNSNTITSSSNIEAEADVFTNQTVIVVEINDNKTVLTSSSKTREGVISGIVEAFPSLSRTEVDAILDFETEDRASRPDDLSVSSDDNDDDNDDDSNSSGNSGNDDDDDDNDNSGSGNSGHGSDN